MTISLLLFQDVTGITSLLQTFGFPVVMALGLSLFAYKVWVNQTKQVETKDQIIKEQIDRSEVFRDRLIESQNKITVTQEKIFDAFDAHTEVMRDIKSTLQTKA